MIFLQAALFRCQIHISCYVPFISRILATENTIVMRCNIEKAQIIPLLFGGQAFDFNIHFCSPISIYIIILMRRAVRPLWFHISACSVAQVVAVMLEIFAGISTGLIIHKATPLMQVFFFFTLRD